MIEHSALPRRKARPQSTAAAMNHQGGAIPTARRTMASAAQTRGLPWQSLWSRQLLQTLLTIAAIALVTVILVLYVLPSSQMNQAQTTIAHLRQERASLARHNAEIIRQITYYTELPTLERRAQALGMGPVQQAIVVQAQQAASALVSGAR